MPDKTDLDAILRALGAEGFGLPFAARSRDYPDHDDLRDADARAHQDNRDALRRALAGRLLPEGGQTRTEWGMRDRTGKVYPARGEQDARELASTYEACDVQVVRQLIFTGPWLHDENRWAVASSRTPDHHPDDRRALERDYGPTREGHGPNCIRPRMEELDRG